MTRTVTQGKICQDDSNCRPLLYQTCPNTSLNTPPHPLIHSSTHPPLHPSPPSPIPIPHNATQPIQQQLHHAIQQQGCNHKGRSQEQPATTQRI